MTLWQQVRSVVGWLIVGIANRFVFHQDDPSRVFICRAIEESMKFDRAIERELERRRVRST